MNLTKLTQSFNNHPAGADGNFMRSPLLSNTPESRLVSSNTRPSCDETDLTADMVRSGIAIPRDKSLLVTKDSQAKTQIMAFAHNASRHGLQSAMLDANGEAFRGALHLIGLGAVPRNVEFPGGQKNWAQVLVLFGQEPMQPELGLSLEDRFSMLKETGIDLNPALTIAITEKKIDTIRSLLKAGAGSATTPEGNPAAAALLLAAKNGDTEFLEALLQAGGIDVNQRGENGDTALIIAAQNGHTAAIGTLLQARGINVNQPRANGYTALMCAAYYGHTEVLKALLQADSINVNQKNNSGTTALSVAAIHGRHEVVKALLQADHIDVNQTDKQETSLVHAAQLGHHEVVKALLQADRIDVNRPGKHGFTALIYAAARGHLEVVNVLLQADRIDVNQPDEFGRTAVTHADRHCNLTLNALLQNVNIRVDSRMWLLDSPMLNTNLITSHPTYTESRREL